MGGVRGCQLGFYLNIMTYKVSVIMLTISIVFILRKYWIAREEKDLCFLNMDKHVKSIKELQIETSENKKSYDRLSQSHGEQIDSIKKEKINAESKLRLCENVNEKKDSDMRKQENSIAEKDEHFENQRKELESLSEECEKLKSEYEQHLTDSKYLEN